MSGTAGSIGTGLVQKGSSMLPVLLCRKVGDRLPRPVGYVVGSVAMRIRQGGSRLRKVGGLGQRTGLIRAPRVSSFGRMNIVIDSARFATGGFPQIDALGSGDADSKLKVLAIRRRHWAFVLVLLGPIGWLLLALLFGIAPTGRAVLLPVSMDSLVRQRRMRRRTIAAVVVLATVAGVALVVAYRVGAWVNELVGLSLAFVILVCVFLTRHLMFQQPRASMLREGAMRLNGVSPAFVAACRQRLQQ